MSFEIDLSPLKELIKHVFVEKNRCKYSLTGKMYVNPFCKFLFILNVIFFPFVLYVRYSSLIDVINEAKMQYNEVDHDDYTRFTPYETLGVAFLFMYCAVVQLLFMYILYVVMKECNCARVTLVFWESPFWKYIGAGILSYIVFILLFVLVFHRYSSFLLPHLLSLDVDENTKMARRMASPRMPKMPKMPRMPNVSGVVSGWFSDPNAWMYGVAALLLLVVLFGGVSTSPWASSSMAGRLDFVDHPRTKPHSCYDCEASSPTSASHLTNKSKCFNCEDQVGESSGWANAGAAQNTKCFTCGDNKLLWRDGIMRHRRPIVGA